MREDLADYIAEHSAAEPDYLRRISRESCLRLVHGRMCSGHVQGRLLKMLTEMVRPRRVLEIGTFSGYSALCIAEGLEGDAFIDTFEINDELEDFIRANLATVPHGERVRLHIGNVEEMLPINAESYDMAFIDANKRFYTDYFRAVFPHIRPGGFIIADNTLWDGHVVEHEYDRDAQTRGIREFNDTVRADARVETVMLPLRDGLTLMRKLCD